MYTVESRFYEYPWETKIGSKNRRVREIRGKVTVLTEVGKPLLTQVIEGSRNRDSTVLTRQSNVLKGYKNEVSIKI